MKRIAFCFATISVFLLSFSLFSMPPDRFFDADLEVATKDLDFEIYFDANNLLMFVTNIGSVAADRTDMFGKFDGLYYPFTGDINDIIMGVQDKTVVYSAGIVLAGKVNDEIRTAVGAYDTEYVPGPMLNGTWQDDRPSFKVYKIDASSGPGDPDYDDWPIGDGAPVDEYSNPLLLGDQTLWAVFNDAAPHYSGDYGGGTNPMGIEIHQTVWGSDEPGEENVLYLKYKLYNRGVNYIDSFFIAFWADPEIGCQQSADVCHQHWFSGNWDDLVGCDTLYDIFFSYNAYLQDIIYGPVPPAWGGTVVSGPVVPSPGDTAIFDGHLMPDFRNIGVSSFNNFSSGTDPDTPDELFLYMKGWDAKAGKPYVDTVTGDTVSFPYAGNPFSGEGWLDADPDDKRLMVSFGPLTFNPEDSQQVVLKLGAYAEDNRLYSLSKLKNILDPDCPVEPVPFTECDSIQTFITDYGKLGDVYFTPSSLCWLEGVNWRSRFFNGGADYGFSLWGGYLDPDIYPDSFHTVEVRFSNTVRQRAYRYVRVDDPNYGYGGYYEVPFTVWDIDDDRQLNVVFIEWTDSDVFDSTWGPDASRFGGREYLMILNSDYDGDNPGDAGTGAIDYTAEDFSDRSAFDFLYAGWFKIRSGHSLSELTDGQKIVFQQQFLNPNGLVDSILFRNTDVGDIASQEVQMKCFTPGRSLVAHSTTYPDVFSPWLPACDLTNGQTFAFFISFTPNEVGYFQEFLYLVDSTSGVLKDAIRLIGLSPPASMPLIIVAYSPVNLTVTDPDGYYIGKDSLGNLAQTLFPATYDDTVNDNDSITIPFPVFGDYLIEVVKEAGKASKATYSLGIRINGSLEQFPVQNAPVPEYGTMDSVTVPPYICGDADYSATVNLLDITYLIDYLYRGGRSPVPPEAGDANGDGGINLLDITYLINYLYRGGPEPVCP